MTKQEIKKMYCKRCNAQTDHKPSNHIRKFHINHAIHIKDLMKEISKLSSPTQGWTCVECEEFSEEEENEPMNQKMRGE